MESTTRGRTSALCGPVQFRLPAWNLNLPQKNSCDQQINLFSLTIFASSMLVYFILCNFFQFGRRTRGSFDYFKEVNELCRENTYQTQIITPNCRTLMHVFREILTLFVLNALVKSSRRHFERLRSFRYHVRRKRVRREDGAIERSGWSGRARAITQLYSSWLPGLTLATCAEVEGETDLHCNDADSYFTAERERSLQEDFGELIVKEMHNDSCR